MDKIINFFKKEKEEVRSPPSLEALPNPNTYLTHISTDKPIYKPGETVYVRAVVLHSLNLLNVNDSTRPEAHLKIFAPNGDNILTIGANYENSVVSAFYKIPDDISGGDYKIQIIFPYDQGFTGAEREFNIRAFRPPRLKTQLKFLQKAYGPGDKATATLEVTRAEGGVPQSATIVATATIDGNEIHRSNVKLDTTGTALITFVLPKTITTGEGTLACKIQDGGVIETATKTIPILLQTMEVHIYPEGGDLIAGLENRFYVEAFTRTKDPADIEAEVRVKKTKEVVGTVITEHEGRGKSSFVPKEGTDYVLHIVKPSGIINEIPFPATKKAGKGAVLKSTEDSYNKDHVIVSVSSPIKSKYTVILSKKMWQLDLQEHEIEAKKEKKFELKTSGALGVLTVTVLQGITPVAERLVFVRPQQSIQVEIQPTKATYVPGDKVELLIKTRTNEGTPIASNVGIQVTDDTTLELVEKRRQAARLPAMVLLEPEVDQLFDSDVLLHNDKYVDLLLGTQGWRRFVTVEKLLEKGIKGERVTGIHNARMKPYQMRFNMFEERMMLDECECAMDFDEKRDFVPALAVVNAPVMALPPPAPLAMAMPAPPPPAIAREMASPPAPPPAQAMPPPPPPAFAQAMPAPAMEVAADMKFEQEQACRPHFDDMLIEDIIRPINDEEEIEQQMIVREYAHVRGPRSLNERTDFTETVYWCASIMTDDNGEAKVSFDLSDSITTFKAFADCFSGSKLGTSCVEIESKNPFYMEPKLPLEVTYGDSIVAPIALVNESAETLQGSIQASIIGSGLKLESSDLDFTLKPQERSRKVVPLLVGDVAEVAKIKLSALTDSVTRPLTIVPTGFPLSFGVGGLLEKNTTKTHKFNVSESFVANSFETVFKAFSTPASTLTESLTGFIREPCGCFEQTSMTSYPLVMVLRYFTTHTGVDPKLVESATEKLTSGYKRLTSYECKSGGFEWFGSDPAHEALTAYGLLQFTEMKKVFPVDQSMLDRTTKWLLGRRDGKGGFQRSSQALDEFGGAPKDTTNAYIVWALTEAGIDVKPEVEEVKNSAKQNNYKDSYLLALITATLYKLKQTEQARMHADKLVLLQNKEGKVKDAAATITMSGGEGRVIETTALAVLSWLNDSRYNENVEKAIQYLQSHCKNGCFGSTQSTVLALKAIVTYDELRSSPPFEGSIVVRLNGKEVTSIGFGKEATGTLEAPSFAEYLGAGEHTIDIEMIEGGRMPYTINIEYYATVGVTDKECAVNLDTMLSTTKVIEGELCTMNIVVENITDQVLPMTVAIIGVPGGLEVRHDQLKEMVKKGDVAFYETKGRNVVFYWRYFKKNEKKIFNIDLIAAVPGKYTAAASKAYLYYTNEYKAWKEGVYIKITEK